MKRLLTGIVLCLTLTGCATSDREVTPPSCIAALNYSSEAFEILGRGNYEEFVEWTQQNSDKISEANQDCRSKADPSTNT